MVLAKLATLVSTFPGPGLPPEWISAGSPASVTGNACSIPAATDFVTRITSAAFYDPTSSSIYGKLALSTPRSYTSTGVTPAFTPYNRIGAQQPGGSQCKTLVGLIPGFTVGQQATGQMKPTIDNYEALFGDHIEAVGVGLPNDISDPTNTLNALQGETRFVVFFAPIVPNNSSGSVFAGTRGDYDTLWTNTITKMVAKGFAGTNVCLRVTEYNSGATSYNNFPWSTGHIDPLTGVAVGIANFKALAAHWETVIRAAGYTGYIEWSGGNSDTSSLAIGSAMPTHATGGNKALAIWGWDLYAATPYGVGKDNVTATWAAANTLYDTYLTYVKANGYMMAHGEYGLIYKSASPYGLNDTSAWWPLFYAKIAANAKWVAYAMHYQQNQPYTPGQVLSESHQLAFCGGAQGVASTTVGSGPNAVGATSLYGFGTTPTAASMGTLHNVSDSGTWTFTTDPNKVKSLAGWRATFANGAGGKGAAGLGVPYVVPATITQGPQTQVIIYPGGTHSPAVAVVLEFDYNQTQSLITSAGVDPAPVLTAAAPSSVWWRITDDGTNVIWATSPDNVTWTNLRTSARPSWWNAVDGVQVVITNHNADGTQTITPLKVSNINNTGVIAPGTTDLAIFDKFNVAPATPAAVSGLQAHVSGNGVALTWNPPAAGTVSGYIVTAQPLNSSSPSVPSQTVTGTATAFLNLVYGSSYVFVVTAFNSAGPGPGSSTSAVNIAAISGGGGVTPTPAATGGLPNSLPIIPIPAVYTPLVLVSGADDGDTLATRVVQRMADLIGNGWRPYLSSPEVAAAQVAAYMAADLRTLVRAAGDGMYAAYGQQILQLPQRYDSPSQITTTWTALDSFGHIIPAGTQVSYPGSGSTPLTFTTRGDMVIPSGSTSITGIVMISDQTGAYTNGVPTGPLEVQGSIIWLDTVVVTTAATGGSDAESDNDYRNRLVLEARTLSQTVILPMDYAMVAQQLDSAVYRAFAMPNFDANNPGTVSPARTVSVYLLSSSGLPVPPDVAASVSLALQARRETNFNVVVLDGSNNAIAPAYVNVAITATVVARPGYSTTDVQTAATVALTNYFDPANWEGGDVTPPSWSGRTLVRPHDISVILANVPGVDHIDQLSIGGGAVAIYGTDNYTLSPSSFASAVLPAGTYASSFWTTPSTIVITANPPAV